MKHRPKTWRDSYLIDTIATGVLVVTVAIAWVCVAKINVIQAQLSIDPAIRRIW